MSENGNPVNADPSQIEGAPDALAELQKTREERDAYQQSAVFAESNELVLHRQLAAYQQQELEQLRAEVRMWRNENGASSENAQEKFGADTVVGEVS